MTVTSRDHWTWPRQYRLGPVAYPAAAVPGDAPAADVENGHISVKWRLKARQSTRRVNGRADVDLPPSWLADSLACRLAAFIALSCH